eukprot:CAMPEP_0172680928 /NCGR_PEP_ID=MMETSP1074-20121228/17107_1 /TAXON_ID=2916 /ORGANISM="Ceratium fusus, Strain PA161109" /LENGTH=40 /DNA_ID= /DNA_START= /DNA_END= /DNA_ORIENTATION=
MASGSHSWTSGGSTMSLMKFLFIWMMNWREYSTESHIIIG